MSSAGFVKQIFNQVLFRDPTEAGSAYWSALLDTGATSGVGMTQLAINSIEVQNKIIPILRLYEAAFGHPPDAETLDHYVDQYNANGASMLSIAKEMATTTEFNTIFNHPTKTNAAFIEQLFLNAFNRMPQSSGLAYWVAQQMSVPELLVQIASSSEMINKTTQSNSIIMEYLAVLKQVPTQSQIDLALLNTNAFSRIEKLYADASYAGIQIPGYTTGTIHSDSSSLDNDNSHTYSRGDAITIKFSQAVAIDSFSPQDILLNHGHSLGEGAYLIPLNNRNGYTTEFSIVLGNTPTLTAGDTLTVAKDSVLHANNQASSSSQYFSVPLVESIAPTANQHLPIASTDRNFDRVYGQGDTLTIRFSEPVSTSLGIKDIITNAGNSLGTNASFTALNANNGFANAFEITLGNGAAIASGNVLRFLKDAIIDKAGNTAAFTVSFIVPEFPVTLPTPSDTTAPTLVSSNPADNATGIAAAANIVLTFSEAIQAGAGNIIVSDGSDIRTIAISNSQISIAGNVLTINPTFNLLQGSTYYVQIDAGAILDLAGNPYSGIANTTTLNFDMVPLDITAPTISAFSVASPTTLSVSSSESGYAGLYDGATQIGSTTTVAAANTSYTLSVAAGGTVKTTAFKLFDDAANSTVSPISVILGTNSADAIMGTSARDFVFGFDGADLLEGLDGADVLIGGAGADCFIFNSSIGNPSDSTITTGYDSIKDLEATDRISVNIFDIVNFDASSASYVVTGYATDEYLLIINTDGDGDDGNSSTSTICIGIGGYNSGLAAAQVDYQLIGTAANNIFTGGAGNDHFTGGIGIDEIHGGLGTDVLRITATGEDSAGEIYDGGGGTSDQFYISGTTTVDFRDDTITSVETLDLSTSAAVQTVSVLASQLAGFTSGVSANATDILNVSTMTGGAMSASAGIDTFIWSNTDHGLNKISSFNRAVDFMRFDFDLNQGSNGAAITTVDSNNDINTNTIAAGANGLSFNTAGKGIYVFAVSISGSDGTSYGGTSGINLSTATEANILANVQASLEYTGGWNSFAGALNSQITQGAAGTDVVFLLDDGSNTAILRYQEDNGDASFTGEISLLGVLTGITAGNFIPAWNGGLIAFYA